MHSGSDEGSSHSEKLIRLKRLELVAMGLYRKSRDLKNQARRI